MHSTLLRKFVIPLLLFAGLAQVRAEEGLAGVYAAIMRGDYEAGRTALVKLRDSGGVSGSELAEVETWLKDYGAAIDSRDQMKHETADWKVTQAQKALAEAQPYLALSFAADAIAYAESEQEFEAQPWVRELTETCLAEAQRLEAAGHWAKAHGYYAALKRIHEQDKRWEELRERAERRARLELLYKDKDELDRRIKGVDDDLLRSTIRLINRTYYREPDFTRLGTGALDNLVSVAETKQLQEYLHGLGNPVTRQAFIDGLKQLRDWVTTEERFGHRDLLNLYDRLAAKNKETVEIPDGLLVMEFLEGALKELDEYTSMVWPVDAPDFDKLMMGGFEGVGIQLSADERSGRLKVVTPLEDSPALEAGVQPGDLIIEVNGESTKGWSTDDAVRNIMGPAGTSVEMTLFRPSSGERLSVPLKRRNIVLRTVRGVTRLPYDPQSWSYILDEESGVAYVRVSGFHPDTHDELVKALKSAERQGMRGLILDVRHNPGGLLDVAVRTVSTFVRDGEVVSTGGRREARTSLRATEEPYMIDVPIVVLVNEGSASASEILAGALQDHERAVVLGERTFGKGSVQRVLSLGNEARLKLTTALYYLPSGRSPHKAPDAETWGVGPDIDVKLTPKEFRQVLKRENDSLIIHNEGTSQAATSEEDREKALAELKGEEEDPDEEPPLLTEEQIKLLDSDPVAVEDKDPQLETALLLLRVKLAANMPWPRTFAAKPPGSSATPAQP